MASKNRKTKVLSYNLHDRCRKYTGVDRSNVDVDVMINLINSNHVQEMVATNSLQGFYGHQIRQRYGMVPPETVPIKGKLVYLSRAFKTIELRASKDGTVEHREEFYDNEPGEIALQDYKAQAGGFSTSVNYKNVGGRLIPTGFFGFDFVAQPNYASNVGDGQLFDGLFVPEEPEGVVSCFDSATDISQLSQPEIIIAQLLEDQILQTYDNINSQLHLLTELGNAQGLVGELSEKVDKQKRLQQLREERKKELYTGMVNPVKSFDSVQQQAEQIIQSLDNPNVKEKPKKPKKSFGSIFSVWG
ncbi:hypothetical protein [Acinetobacter baumannii]|uniref:hypothetical protein n=1 Tax=Acinetobacter baumannii TaxID=470 RepID=UPI000F3D9582|nr:hypothetical protein [Acinetobacter baumannii]NDM09807.1 hypothetical protein [Acinetobacter baumannii]RND08453.1 hypothetical protein ED855_16340 [Acinetobacter baumannii]